MLYTCSFSSIHQGARRRLSRDMACSDNWALEHPVAQSRLDDAYSCQRRVRMGECAPVQQEVHCARSCGRCSLSSSSAAAASPGRPRHPPHERASCPRPTPSSRHRCCHRRRFLRPRRLRRRLQCPRLQWRRQRAHPLNRGMDPKRARLGRASPSRRRRTSSCASACSSIVSRRRFYSGKFSRKSLSVLGPPPLLRGPPFTRIRG